MRLEIKHNLLEDQILAMHVRCLYQRTRKTMQIKLQNSNEGLGVTIVIRKGIGRRSVTKKIKMNQN
jgi:hypothetical protein